MREQVKSTEKEFPALTEHSKKTVIVGASTNSSRYAYKAAHRLRENGHPIVPVSIKKGSVAGEEILDIRKKPMVGEVDTITMYIGPRHQAEWMEYLISLHPKRIIFNPGTENPVFEEKAEAAGIETIEACTLVLLSLGEY